jgi:hypothetical protein
MSNHPTSLYGIPPMELGRQLAKLRYDALRDVMFALMCQLNNDSKADAARDRPKLADALEKSAMAMALAQYHMVEAWKICEPHEV